MQLMTWTSARLGSRFSLLFEPYKRRVMHSALGRFLDRPLDLMVGLIEPDGTRRTLPFSDQGQTLRSPEQFERFNSITFRGHSERYRLRFELNVHSVFYPQNERICLLPAFYLEMRVSPSRAIRWSRVAGPTPEKVKLFLRLGRAQTQISASAQTNGRIDLAYQCPTEPTLDADAPGKGPTVAARERIVSLNPGCVVDETGRGLELELPVTETGSGVKWRLVWAAHVSEPVLRVGATGEPTRGARLRYNRYWPSLESVTAEAIEHRDDYLARSRLLEKIFEQAPLEQTQRHLIDQSFGAYLANTYWCDVEGQPDTSEGWFSVWEGSCFFHSTVDVEYNVCLFYLSLWPKLLAMQLDQWTHHVKPHAGSGGGILSHDMGAGAAATGQAYPHDMPVEENANYLLMMQAYVRWTGDLATVKRNLQCIGSLTRYLVWSDRDESGFPSEGTANTIDDALPAVQFSRKQTYLAVKRLAALRAAADMLDRCGHSEEARRYERIVDQACERVDREAWLGDHYAVCVDRSAAGVVDAWTGEQLPQQEIVGWDAYSIYTGNGLLLPLLCGQPPMLDPDRLVQDAHNAIRETKSPYGCGHTSVEPENVWVSQNIWRDILMRYLGQVGHGSTSRYWDLQVMNNTHAESSGFIDTYVTNNLCFYPRGIVSLGYLLSRARLVIDRLSPGGVRVSIDPDRHWAQRWPLLPLADWKAGKVPVCVVNTLGQVTVEGECDPVIVRGQASEDSSGLIG